ncbi:MAG: FAD-binding oxidoreductase [Actinobacteria bacterium]|nr:FAD-binding oxidoreductase [Actinomycetota bacterium]MCL6104443.1 FAD-binding oxidoreductase [Actinomycetota bacterium]
MDKEQRKNRDNDQGQGHLRKFWGWGWQDVDISEEEKGFMKNLLSQFFGIQIQEISPPNLEDIQLPTSKIKDGHISGSICAFTDSPYQRASHTYGKSYKDIIRSIRGNFAHPPDLVAFPENENEILNLLGWCSDKHIAAIPYGGGSSVVGGVEPDIGEGYSGTLSIDLSRLNKVLEIDTTSRTALIQAGVYGPDLEQQLKRFNLSLRHFPQSFEFSTLGGWIATRSGGHFATLYTHIDEFVESLYLVTPQGTVETRRLPGSGAGPSPDRLFIGSEGIFGIITQAWVKLWERPRFRASVTMHFKDFTKAVEACRLISQSGLYPTNCRLLDPTEALMNFISDGTSSLLLVGFESADYPVTSRLKTAIEICKECQGEIGKNDSHQNGSNSNSSVNLWKKMFLKAPYLRDALVLMGIFCETFETCVTWDRFFDLHDAVENAARQAVGSTNLLLSCRFTHVYPDGPAPYYTLLTPAVIGSELQQWTTVKSAISDAILKNGGTITHHHAIGREHRPWYDKQRPELFGQALKSVKSVLDPQGIMNPGVLIDVAPNTTYKSDTTTEHR